jgi:Lar family restriction alleviation protein
MNYKVRETHDGVAEILYVKINAKRCPFCGSDDIIVRDSNRKDKVVGYWVFCCDCFTEGPFDINYYRAIERWNTRYED